MIKGKDHRIKKVVVKQEAEETTDKDIIRDRDKKRRREPGENLKKNLEEKKRTLTMPSNRLELRKKKEKLERRKAKSGTSIHQVSCLIKLQTRSERVHPIC